MKNRLRILKSGDPKTAFPRLTPAEILDAYGPPRTLLSNSAKAEKCARVGVLNRVLYFTPGIFCPASTPSCRAACLGHTSGNMQLPGSAVARDQRASLYLADTEAFFTQLYRELRRLEDTANRLGVRAAVRLNGTSDIPWERLHPNVFLDFPDIAFFDYTKIRPRMHSYLSGYIHSPSLERVAWPKNYHLTFSGDGNRQEDAREVLDRGGNVALVFWPGLPNSCWGHLVIDGDEHDARFLDPRGIIVGLRAKGIARVELDGFVVRPCPECGETAQELQLVSVREDTHRHAVHRCGGCGFECRSRWILPHALKRCDMRLPVIAA